MTESSQSTDSQQMIQNEAEAVLSENPVHIVDEQAAWIKFSFTVVIFMVIGLYFVIPAIFPLSAPENAETTPITGLGMLISLLFSQLPVITILIMLAFFFHKEVSICDKFQLKNWNWAFLALPFGLELLIFPTLILVTLGFQELVSSLFNYQLPAGELETITLTCSNTAFIIIAVGAVIVAPIIEELVFRKVIYDFMEKQAGRIIAVIFTSLLFAAVHGSIIKTPALFILALVLQLLYISYRSICPCIILHMVHNGSAILLVAIARHLMQYDSFRILIENSM